MDELIEMGIGLIVLVIILGVLIGLFILGYSNAPKDKMFIISGLRKEPKMFSGKAAFRIPFFERCDSLLLNLTTVNLNTGQTIPTNEFINVQVEAMATVKINNKSKESLIAASENFLNKSLDYIGNQGSQILEGVLREIIGQMALVELVHDRERLAKKVEEATKEELAKIGLTVENFKIQNFSAEGGAIENLGIENLATIEKSAKIARANADKEVAVAQAEADSLANEADVKSKLEIAERDNNLKIEKAKLKAISDKEQAIADASFDLSAQEARKRVEIATVDADIAKTEREAEQRAKEIQVKENMLRASIEKQADAEKYEKEVKAAAERKAREEAADAKAYEVTKQAEAAKQEVELSAYEIEREAKAKMEEAKSILALGQAEAKIMKEKAEALNIYNNEALQQMLISNLPEIMKAVAEPLAKVDTITMYGSGNVSNLIEDTFSSTTGLVEGIKNSTGIDLGSLLTNTLATKAGIESSSINKDNNNANNIQK